MVKKKGSCSKPKKELLITLKKELFKLWDSDFASTDPLWEINVLVNKEIDRCGISSTELWGKNKTAKDKRYDVYLDEKKIRGNLSEKSSKLAADSLRGGQEIRRLHGLSHSKVKRKKSR